MKKKFVSLIFIFVNYNYEIRKKSVFGFSISYSFLEIFRFQVFDIYVN